MILLVRFYSQFPNLPIRQMSIVLLFLTHFPSANSVKSCFQNMEICKRRVNMYDTVNQSKTPFITHVAPSTSTNLTMTFNNQLNTVHNQVSGFTTMLCWAGMDLCLALLYTLLAECLPLCYFNTYS